MPASKNLKQLQIILNQGVAEGVYPGAALLVALGPEVLGVWTTGRLGLEAGPVDRNTVWDLASVSKVLSTTILIMICLDEGRFTLEDRLPDLLGKYAAAGCPPDKADITLRQLLAHSSGLKAWLPFYEELIKLPPEQRRSAVSARILKEPPETAPDQRAIYSDLNFILLGLILEETGGARQEILFKDRIAKPLDLPSAGYRPLDADDLSPAESIAQTEVVSYRGGLIQGVVHDDNTWSLSGVAGHAGLFAPIDEVWDLFRNLRRSHKNEPGFKLVRPETVKTFWEYKSPLPDSTRALGFDHVSPQDSQAGRYFSTSSLGHLGYTGNSLWHDPLTDLTVILLTNRVHPTAKNEKIKAFRPRIHDAVFEACVGSQP